MAEAGDQERAQSDRALVSALFAAAFVVAVVCCAVATGMALYGASGPTSGTLLALVGVSLAIACGLVAMAVGRLARVLWRHVGGAPTPRLHLRFVALFSFAAITPAVLLALFFGVLLSRGLETWFGERVEASVDAARAVGQAYLDHIVQQTESDIAGAAVDFSNEATQAQSLFPTPEGLLAYLATYRGFLALYVVDSAGQRLVSAESQAAPEFRPPTAVEFAEANAAADAHLAALDAYSATMEEARSRGAAPSTPPPANDAAYVDVDQDAGVLRALARLEGAEDRYLYAVPDVSQDMFNEFRAAGNAVATFNEARDQRERIETFFVMIYFVAALLILSGSIWLALSAAGRVADPIGRLVVAADRVRRGDFDARVRVADDDDEVSALGRAFNLMTSQIALQQHALIDANRESEGRRRLIEAVLVGVSAGVLSVDGQNRVGLANRSANVLLGAEKDMLLDQVLEDFAPGLAEIATRARARAGETVEQEIELSRAGVTLTFNVRAAADREDSGRVVLTLDDITRLIAAQRNAAWRDVARRIAHEIKNPLTPIQLSAERLRRRYRPAEDPSGVFDRCTDTIIRQVSDIGRMVDEFSAFARMPQPHIERTELQDLAQETVFARRVASPDIRLTLATPPAPLIVLCDARLASQALANILKNAAESVSERIERGEDMRPGRIDVRLMQETGFGVVEIADNGLGWPAGARDRLTEPYMTTREKGTGLGLAIVQRIMEDHGGRLELAARGDGERGAVVRLAFPTVEADQKATAAE